LDFLHTYSLVRLWIKTNKKQKQISIENWSVMPFAVVVMATGKFSRSSGYYEHWGNFKNVPQDRDQIMNWQFLWTCI
jgi:hypothetical protein